jgi:hypothetical protein
MQLSEVSKKDVEFTPDIAWKRWMDGVYGKRPYAVVRLDELQQSLQTPNTPSRVSSKQWAGSWWDVYISTVWPSF